MRVLVALGGNAMTGPDGSAARRSSARHRPRDGARRAKLVEAGHDVVLTHGNGPQVGNLLVKNELAAHVVPPVPLDWCGAQTQGTIGFTILDTLEGSRPAAWTAGAPPGQPHLVDADDPGFASPPSRSVGSCPTSRPRSSSSTARSGRTAARRLAPRRRLEPLEVLETHTLLTLMEAGYVVVAAGGGGIPVIRTPDGKVHGIEAVIDKDLTAAVLARAIRADVLVIATDVENAIVGYGTPQAQPVGASPSPRCRRMPRRATSRPAPWGRRSTRRCGSCAAGVGAASSPLLTASEAVDSADGSIGTVIEGDSPTPPPLRRPHRAPAPRHAHPPGRMTDRARTH